MLIPKMSLRVKVAALAQMLNVLLRVSGTNRTHEVSQEKGPSLPPGTPDPGEPQPPHPRDALAIESRPRRLRLRISTMRGTSLPLRCPT